VPCLLGLVADAGVDVLGGVLCLLGLVAEAGVDVLSGVP
jgi:hypothetical protein